MHLPTLKLDRVSALRKHFALHQICWIDAEDHLHDQGRQVCALAEKSIRIGWTYADAFKNVRKRLRFKNRDYLFATKDYPSALEYMRQAWEFAELFDLTRSIVSHGEESLKIPRLDSRGRSSGFTEEIKLGVIKFDNGSRILAFSSNPQAMAVYGGDVGLDEFARHPNARLLWETAQGRVALANDIAVWSAHDGEDTLFYQFAQQARAACGVRASSPCNHVTTQPCNHPPPPSPCNNVTAQPSNSLVPLPSENCTLNTEHYSNALSSPWNLYFHITMPDAIELGFLDTINAARGTSLKPEQFLADCRSRAGLPEIYEQSYLCNPVSPAASIVDWSAIERCRHEYQIERLHLEHQEILKHFGDATPHHQLTRQQKIEDFLHSHFPSLFVPNQSAPKSDAAGSGKRTSDGLRAKGR